MSVVSRGALLVSAASLATGLLTGPTAAYAADTTTSLSATEMAAALKAVGTASTQAGAEGWKAGVTMTGDSKDGAPMGGTESFVADPADHMTYQSFSFGGETMSLYTVAGKGGYASLDDPRSRAALRMMHRSSVRYVFTPTSSAATDPTDMSPATVLTDDVDHPGTEVVHDDGSADYRLAEQGATVAFHVDPAGVLTSAVADSDGMHFVLTYAYGPQHLTPPAASVTIGSGTLAVGLAYLDMSATVKQVAGDAATDALRAAHGHQVSVASLRSVARRDARSSNQGTGVAMVKAGAVAGGVRVYATNPWTHSTVSYTLKASGRKVTIAKK